MAATVLHRFTLMLLLVFCHLFLSIECKVKRDLTVFKGNLDVTDTVFINGSNDCLTSFDTAHLPPEVDGSSVERPTNFRVPVLDSRYGEYLVTGIHVKWSSPFSGADRKNLKGFFVLMKSEKEYNDRCRLYLVNHTAFGEVLDFSFRMNNFAQKKDNFVITIYSLPPPRTMNETGTFGTALVTSKATRQITYPGLWIPSISTRTSLDQGLGSVDVYFTLPPKIEGWLLEQFEVMLLKCSKSLSMYYKSEIITKDKTTTDIEGHWQFGGLIQDLYSVVVRVKNYNTSLCICWKGDYCSISCGSVQTAWFDLSGNKHDQPQEPCSPFQTTTEITTEPPLFVVPSSESTEQPRGETSQEPTTEVVNSTTEVVISTTEVAIGISVAVLVIGLVTYLLVVYFCWRRRKDKQHRISTPSNPRTRSPVPHDAEDILRKVVYIMATADHQASIHVLDAFCDLLEKYCQCDVINPRKVVLTQTCESAWVTASMSKSDCVVFVNFKGMETLVDAFLDSQTMPPEPNHSLLHKALQIAFNSSHANHRNFISVIFTQDWTQDKLALLNPKKFVLPRELTPLFAGVHNISEQCAEKYLRKSLLKVDRLENLPEYQALKGAVGELSKFENDSKNFFDTNYNIVRTTSSKAPASTSSSVSSGCSSTIHGSLSGSLTDISPDADSPVSVFGQPTFQQIPSSPDDGIDVDESNIFSIGSVPRFYNVMMDGQSAVTVGYVSDVQYSDTQKCGQSGSPHLQPIPPCTLSDIECDDVSTALKQINEDSQMSEPSAPKDPQPLQVIIPPRFKTALSKEEDSISTRITDLNADNCSTWSKPSDLSASCHMETKKNGVKQRPAVIKPPRLSIPADNTSTMLEAFNDQDSVICFVHEDSAAHEKDEFYDSGLPEMSV